MAFFERGAGLRAHVVHLYCVARWLTVESFRSALNKDLSLLAAGLAFFALISMAPFLVIALAIGGAVFGNAAAREEIYLRLSIELGPDTADLVLKLVEDSRNLESLSIATVASVLLLLWASSRLFGEVRRALHLLWDMPPEPARNIRHAILRFLGERLLAAAGVLVFGVIFLLLLGSRVAISIADDLVGTLDFFDVPIVVWSILQEVAAFIIATVGVLIIYRFLPRQRPRGWPLLIGALVTAGILLIGRALIAVYLATGLTGSTYGAAGSLFVFLIWAHFSAMGFLLGARLTHLVETRAFRAVLAGDAPPEVLPEDPDPIEVPLEAPPDPEVPPPSEVVADTSNAKS